MGAATPGLGGGRTGIGAIDSIRDGVAQRVADLDRLRQELRALEDDNDRLRREAVQSRADLLDMQRQFAGTARELAMVYASRSWKIARLLRRIFRRRSLRRGLPPATEAGVPPAADPGATPPVTLVVLPPAGGARADAADLLRRSLGAASCKALWPGQPAPGEMMPGERVVLWDGTSEPHPGWLQALDECLDRFDGAGMAGALLLAPDGRIAAAGATILPDGRLAPLGCGERPDHPAFASVAPVEALAFGAVMIPADIWRRFGGLDPEITCPTLALADFALRLREAGLRVLCQPFARLTAPAVRAPADPWADAFGRWRVRRRRAAGGSGLASLGLSRPSPPRALFVDNLVPTPDRDSGSGDIHCVMRIFVALGYQVTFLPVGDLARADRYVDDLRRHGVRVAANGLFSSAEAFLAGEKSPFDLIMLHRGSLAGGPLFDKLRDHSPQARLVFNAVDLHFLRLEREALLTRSPGKLEEAFRAEQIEMAVITRADCTVLLSHAEQRLVADLLPLARTCVIPIAREIAGRRAPFAPRRGVLFVGGFRHQPNVDAVLAFARDVWPLVRRRLAVPLGIVGGDVPPEVQALANAADGIVVHGHVEDLAQVLAGCRLTVAPLRFGAGIKGKIVSSLAAGVPCAASPIAVEGMGLADGVHLRVAGSPEAFADAVVEVHEDEATWTALSDAGLDFATATFSVAGAKRRISAMLRDLGLPAGVP